MFGLEVLSFGDELKDWLCIQFDNQIAGLYIDKKHLEEMTKDTNKQEEKTEPKQY